MTTHARLGWEERNNAYLADALAWVRARLGALVAETAETGMADERSLAEGESPDAAPRSHSRSRSPEKERPRSFLSVLFSTGERAAPKRPTPTSTSASDQRGTSRSASSTLSPAGAGPSPAAAASVAAEASGEPPPAHVELARRLGLSDFERDVLLLTVAAELDPNVAALCARVQPAYTRGHPTFGLAMRLFDNPAWEALGPHGSLRRLHLLSVDTEPGVVNGRLRADERVVNFVKGLDHLDERLAVLLAPMATGEGDVGTTPSQAPVVDAIRRRIDATPGGPVLVNLIGPDTVSKRLIAERAATDAGRYPLRVPITNLPPVGRDLDLLIRLWERDALLSPVALYLDASDEVSSAGGEGAGHSRQAVDRLLGRARGLVFLDSREAWANLEAGALVLDVPGPSGAEQRAAWASVLGQGQQATAADLAAQFDLDLLAIRSASAAGIEDDGPDAVRKAALQLTRPRLDLLAQRVEPKAKSNDLVVTDEVADQLARIKQQVLHRATVHGDWGLEERTSRGLGITALFAGESGTGKTLAAEVLAGDLGLNLYRIDLSAVVSKYIGETEKNLRRLFDAAERGGTILFFDEADALFGKRSEVRDSHDRYANIEVNYLLQRMEGYRGLAILATNMKSALDRAFARRLRFVVDFPFPGLPERERIWRRSFVERVDAAGLDYASLAKLVLTGGSIHNVAVNATFAAAATPGQALTMPMVLAAARMEYRKLGLPVNEADFRWQEAPARELAGAAAQVGPS